MGEILFRGKSIEDNNWVYGDLIREKKSFGKICTRIYKTTNNGWELIDVDSKTVGRYTGLTDKNGNKIFEGDILKLILESKESDIPVIVKYGQYIEADSLDDSKYLGWYLDIKNKCVSILLGENDGIELEFEVAGNIFDNPELLEE